MSLSASVPTSPRTYGGDRRHVRSRSSIAALRAALSNYQVPPEIDYDHTMYGAGSGSDELVSELELDNTHYYRAESERTRDLKSPFNDGDGNEMMDALVDIHRVLYRGRENMADDVDEGLVNEEIRRVTERWFEGDCCEFLRFPSSRCIYPALTRSLYYFSLATLVD